MENASVILTTSEWQVMEGLWTGPKTLVELVRELDTSVGWAKSTVTAMVRRMEEKGPIAYAQSGRVKVFSAAVSRDAVTAAETDSLLKRACHGSVGLLVNAMVEQESLPQAGIDELHAGLCRVEEERS